MTTLRKELTWSRKWHYVRSEETSASDRYLVALCGAYLEYDGGSIRYPDHLRDIKVGRRKSTGTCKICTRMAGDDNTTAIMNAVRDSLIATGLQSSPTAGEVQAFLSQLAAHGFEVK